MVDCIAILVALSVGFGPLLSEFLESPSCCCGLMAREKNILRFI
jgi:hypothetical protein